MYNSTSKQVHTSRRRTKILMTSTGSVVKGNSPVDDVNYLINLSTIPVTIRTSTGTHIEYRNNWIRSRGLYIFPKFIIKLIDEDHKPRYRLVIGKDGTLTHVTYPPFKLTLRDYQNTLLSDGLNALHKFNIYGGVVINIGTGLGKTIIALKMIAELSLPTIIVIPKLVIKQQWEDSIMDVFGTMPSSIMIVTYQLLLRRPKSFRYVPLLVVDEVHHYGAEKLMTIMMRINHNYVIGLSATIEREDGSDALFMQHFNTTLTTNIEPYSNTLKAVFVITKDPCNCNSFIEYQRWASANIMMFFNWVAPRVINDPNRKTLFVTRLVKDAEDISNELSIRGVKHVLITGSRSKKVINEGLLDDESNQAIVGTYGTVGEGFDVKWLNTLVILMPLRASLEQLVGRVQRKSHIIPVMVYDFIAYSSHIAKYQMKYKEDTLTALGFDISYKYMYNDPYDDMI